jgi:hypothetical protein
MGQRSGGAAIDAIVPSTSLLHFGEHKEFRIPELLDHAHYALFDELQYFAKASDSSRFPSTSRFQGAHVRVHSRQS